MNIYSKENSLDTYTINETKTLSNEFTLIEKVLDTDISKLTDKEYFDLLSGIGQIKLTIKDYIEMANKITGFKDANIIRIVTDMSFKVMCDEGHGRDFSWWYDDYLVGYTVLTTNKLSTSQIYSADEIKQLIDNKEMFIIASHCTPLGNFSNDYFIVDNDFVGKQGIDRDKPISIEKYHEFLAIVYVDGNEEYNFVNNFYESEIELSDTYFDEELKYVRKKVSKTMLLNVLRRYIYNLVDNIDYYIGRYNEITEEEAVQLKGLCKKIIKNYKPRSDCFKL